MNTKLLRMTADQIRRFLLNSGAESGIAYQGFIYAVTEYYLEINGFRFRLEQIVPEMILPGELHQIFPELRKKLRNALNKEEIPVQVIGWMHQYYHIEEKDRIFTDKHHKQFAESELPTATQFFTPEWLVQYMLENSLGRMFPLNWEYTDFLPEESNFIPEEVKLVDPCAGTGHILLYAFDMFMKIYLSRGISSEIAVRSILQKNLFGLELDVHACRIAEFSLMIKALEQDNSFLESGIRPNLHYFDQNELEGSLLSASQNPEIDQLLKRKYQIVVTNPPYMGSSGMPSRLSAFVKTEYPDSWHDLYACFIERCSAFTQENGFCAMLTMQNWLFLPGFAKLRKNVLESQWILNLLHLGAYAFDTADVGTIVQNVCWIMQKKCPAHQKGIYYYLCDYQDTELKREIFLNRQAKRYEVDQKQFSRIPDSPVIYWASESILKLFQFPELGNSAEPKQGITTSDNIRFVRLWHEVNFQKICFDAKTHQQAYQSRKKWFPYHKGGGYRKWYGNHLHILNYQDNGRELLRFHEQLKQNHSGGRVKNKEYYFRESLTWTFIAKKPGFRKNPAGFLFDVAGSSLFADSESEQNALLAYLCSKPAEYLLYLLNPTMNIQARDLKHLPYIRTDNERIQKLVEENMQISQQDWDSFEISWNFKHHPLI